MRLYLFHRYLRSRLSRLFFKLSLVIVISISFVGMLQLQAIPQQDVMVRVDRWLNLEQKSGTVLFSQGSTTRVANVGDRLQAVGDGLTTEQAASAMLSVDTGVGFVDVSQNTEVRIKALDTAPDNGRITHLEVPRGQVRLQVRPFTHQGSELEIYTPAGVSGVRGTEFGINVQTDGKMGVATLSGGVETSAQGETVVVPGGYQNLTIPGEPPQPATPLTNSTELTYEILRSFQGNLRRAYLVGQVDPVNSVFFQDQPIILDREGRFTLDLQVVNRRRRLTITVITPLGREQAHELIIDL